MNRHQTFYVEERNLEEIEFCGKKILSFSGGFYETPFAIIPTKGNHSLSSCKGCRKYHSTLIKAIEERFKKFPNCCNRHKMLFKIDRFNLNDFKNYPEITADKILYTFHHIINYIDNENWFNDITDYIEYAIVSYGSFPPKYGQPFDLSNFFVCVDAQLEHFKLNFKGKYDLIDRKEVIRRIEVITNHLNSYFDEEPVVKTDMNLLLDTYNRWY